MTLIFNITDASKIIEFSLYKLAITVNSKMIRLNHKNHKDFSAFEVLQYKS